MVLGPGSLVLDPDDKMHSSRTWLQGLGSTFFDPGSNSSIHSIGAHSTRLSGLGLGYKILC